MEERERRIVLCGRIRHRVGACLRVAGGLLLSAISHWLVPCCPHAFEDISHTGQDAHRGFISGFS
jgi:hypothetical protein